MKVDKNIKNIVRNSVWTIAISLALISCTQQNVEEKNPEVFYFGALKKIMNGELKAHFDLGDLKNLDHVYALGAEERLKGEIQIFNGESMFSSVKSSQVEIDSSFNQKASLLVYAKVPEWITVEISGFESVSILESEIYRIAKSRGVDVANPFSFLLEGRVDSLAWHVIDWDENDKIHTHKKHKSSGLNGILENETVRIIGFYSKEHKGIFTHHTRDSHMHFRSMNRPLAGHLDELSMSGAINLKLPNNEKAL